METDRLYIGYTINIVEPYETLLDLLDKTLEKLLNISHPLGLGEIIAIKIKPLPSLTIIFTAPTDDQRVALLMVLDVLKELKKHINYDLDTLTPPCATPDIVRERLVSPILPIFPDE